MAQTGVPLGALHGGKPRAVSTPTLAKFKDLTYAAPVATDVAVSGIQVYGILLVANVDILQDYEDHPHRSGRTVRAGELDTESTLATSKH